MPHSTRVAVGLLGVSAGPRKRYGFGAPNLGEQLSNRRAVGQASHGEHQLSNGSSSGSAHPAAYDVVFVGAGISNTFTLIELLARLERHESGFLRVLVVDRDPDLFKGVPYGARSGDLGLIISRTSDFLPEPLYGQFVDWLADHRDRAFARFFAWGGDLVDGWRRASWADIEAGTISELHLPRSVFGLFFDELARAAIARAELSGVASCATLVAEVVDVIEVDGGFSVVTRGADGESIHPARRVVLGLGSAPTRRMLTTATDDGPALIDDPFEPGVADMLARIRAAVARRPDAGRVVVLGSNASALDVLYNLVNDPVIAAAIEVVEVRSGSGALPELFEPRPATPRSAFVGRALNELASRDDVRADDILDAATRDLEGARRDGLTVTDTLWGVSLGFLALLDRLSPEQKLRFASDTGPRIGALQRRAGKDYRDVVDILELDGKLDLVAERVEAGAHWGDDDVLAVINCAGGESLGSDALGSPLLRTLLDRGAVRPSGSPYGVAVDDDLETATPGLFLIGPMLTGNVLRDDPAWNLEHCGRIVLLAGRLAAHLAGPTLRAGAA